MLLTPSTYLHIRLLYNASSIFINELIMLFNLCSLILFFNLFSIKYVFYIMFYTLCSFIVKSEESPGGSLFLRPCSDCIERIIWDPKLDINDFSFIYQDRLLIHSIAHPLTHSFIYSHRHLLTHLLFTISIAHSNF